MSSAYGTLYFSKSDDCDFDAKELIKKLNTYKWTECDTSWTIDDQTQQVTPTKTCSQYPTAYPEKIISITAETESGETILITADNVAKINQNDLDILDIKSEEVDLDSICLDISPAIKNGSIEISINANGKGYDYFQSIQIFSSGQGIRHYMITGQKPAAGSKLEYTRNFCQPK